MLNNLEFAVLRLNRFNYTGSCIKNAQFIQERQDGLYKTFEPLTSEYFIMPNSGH